MTDRSIARVALGLGIAGLLPQVACVAATFDDSTRYIGLAAGYFYAALIFSFLGGIWWGVAAGRHDAPNWIYAAAVVPSLIAFTSGIPWMTGAPWPQPSLGWLGTALIASVIVDRQLAKRDLINDAMLRLRYLLSFGLGGLTLVLATR